MGDYSIYDPYLKICQEAVDDDSVFKDFKSRAGYKAVLEHVNHDEGLGYIAEITKEFPYLWNFIDKFSTNDNIGDPYRCSYKASVSNEDEFYPSVKEIKMVISPTTLRYIKVLADLMNLFGRLDAMNIVEIGGGYGGQCKIISDVAEVASYTLIDRCEALALSEKYLKRNNVSNVILRQPDDASQIHYDLCISNYAFAEIQREYQNFYAENIIKNSDRGYMTCNIFGYGAVSEPMTKEEIIALKPDYEILPEIPLTAVNNIIYTWGRNKHFVR